MLNVTYACPQCGLAARVDLPPGAEHCDCPHCRHALPIRPGAFEGGHVHRCIVCPSTELFVRKDFPQRLGVAIVVLGFAASCVSWAYYQVYLTFAILFLTALVDVVLYVLVGESLTCYRCHAEYRGVTAIDEHGAFELATHERYRQQAARLGQAASGRTSAGR